MVTRIKVLFAIGIFVITTLISNAIFGENGTIAINVLQNNVNALREVEERKKEELGFLRESTSSSMSVNGQEMSHIMSFEEDEIFQPEISDNYEYLEEYNPLSIFGSALIGLAASGLYVIICLVVEIANKRKRK